MISIVKVNSEVHATNRMLSSVIMTSQVEDKYELSKESTFLANNDNCNTYHQVVDEAKCYSSQSKSMLDSSPSSASILELNW